MLEVVVGLCMYNHCGHVLNHRFSYLKVSVVAYKVCVCVCVCVCVLLQISMSRMLGKCYCILHVRMIVFLIKQTCRYTELRFACLLVVQEDM